jgi:glutathione S-transferase
MKLYFAPGACSLAPHIVAHEAGLALDLDRVDLRSRTTESGENFAAVNPMGYVPALRLDSGEVLTEAGVLVQYLADQNPASGLLPPAGTLERYRVMEWIGFISTELHKGFGALWNPTTPEAVRQAAVERLQLRFAHLDRHLADRSYLMGDGFTAADAYCFTIVSWTKFHKIDISAHENLAAYLARVAARPKVVAAMQAEGLLAAAA